MVDHRRVVGRIVRGLPHAEDTVVVADSTPARVSKGVAPRELRVCVAGARAVRRPSDRARTGVVGEGSVHTHGLRIVHPSAIFQLRVGHKKFLDFLEREGFFGVDPDAPRARLRG